MVESLDYCQKNKGLVIHAWVLMTNHIHLIVSVDGSIALSDILRDFKKFTSKKIVAAIEGNEKESYDEVCSFIGFIGSVVLYPVIC